MTIVAAIGKACGLYGSCAARPKGLVVIVTRQGGLRRVGARGERAFYPALQDIVADDWEVGDIEATVDSFHLIKALPAEPAS